MTPKPYTVYKMKKSYYKSLFVGKVKKCATECGNRFRYLPKEKYYVNMECLHCGYQFHTITLTFAERYKEIGPDLDTKNPNYLFRNNGRQL